MIDVKASLDEVLSAENEECDDMRLLTDREKYNMVMPVLIKIFLLISMTFIILKCQLEEAKYNVKALKYHPMIQRLLMEIQLQ